MGLSMLKSHPVILKFGREFPLPWSAIHHSLASSPCVTVTLNFAESTVYFS